MTEKTIFVREHNKDNPYTTISNKILQNKSLSWKARGLLAYMLSLPKNWKFNMKHLESQATEGPYQLKQAIKELEDAGHLVRRRVHVDGRFIWKSVVREYVEDPMDESNWETALGCGLTIEDLS